MNSITPQNQNIDLYVGGVQQDAVKIDPQYQALAYLWDEPLTYVKQYAEALDSITQGYFLSYFSQYCLPGEWVVLNGNIVRNEIGLSFKEWNSVRKALLDRDILRSNRKIHSTLFTLNDHRFEALIRQHAETSVLAVSAPPLPINKLQAKSLLNNGASVKAVILLAAIQSLTDEMAIHEREALSKWIRLPEKLITQITFLTRKEQKSAYKQLNQLGVIELEYRSFPKTKYGRYSLKKLGELTAIYALNEQIG